jgi:glycerol kinase
MANYLLAIDQGTTSTRAAVFNERAQCLASAAVPLNQHFPKPGWVEHDPEDIWDSVAQTVPVALARARIAGSDVAAVGVTNQRETVVLWDRQSGRAVSRAVVWQDRRTAEFCRQRHGDEGWIRQRTGLVLDPYFSASKLHWLLENDAELRRRAEGGELACGTVDSWLLWRLTGGAVHRTDASNASRTLLLDLGTARWDAELCRFFGVPEALLPEIRPSASEFGRTAALGFLPAGVPISGVAGDQQAALFGQGGTQPGDAKCTYGTGAFYLLHTGTRRVDSRHRLLTSLAAQTVGPPQYVLEGSVFIAGAAVQWLRDGLHLIGESHEVEALADRADPAEPALLVPGFVGLGAPHWVPEARGVLFSLTRATTAADLARAALDGVALQVVDLVAAADLDFGQPLAALRVDGGMAQNAWFLQRQADLLGRPVLPAVEKEATALGAALLAGLTIGVWPNTDAVRHLMQATPPLTPRMSEGERQNRLADWHHAVEAVIAFYSTRREPT